jgi:hypothetical protein
MKKILFILMIAVTAFGCVNSSKKESVQPIDTASLLHQVTVEEVIQTSVYTYLKVKENGNEFWMAVNKQDASVGQKYYYDAALEMTDFESKELNRKFDKIFFVQNISTEPIVKNNPVAGKESPKGKALEAYNENIKVETAEGEVSISGLYSDKADYEGKKVTVSGQVVKVNNNIMGQNWIHLQDGSRHQEFYDLTVTSQQTAKVGDQITAEGTITLNKDFGAGYFYDLIMEDAQLK